MGAPAGPDNKVLEANRCATWGDMTPPLDCMMSRLPVKVLVSSWLSNLDIYRVSTGPT